jgi:drug/metabolite transporter (DMT)-like permease
MDGSDIMSGNPLGIALAMFCVGLNTVGQVLLKKFAISFDWGGMFELRILVSQPMVKFLLPGIACYIVGMAAWIGSLKIMPLYVAYPIIGLSFVTVPLLSSITLGEPLNPRTLLGAALIIAGIFVTSYECK